MSQDLTVSSTKRTNNPESLSMRARRPCHVFGNGQRLCYLENRIGVEPMSQNDSFVEFIKEQIEIIKTRQVGAKLLNFFNKCPYNLIIGLNDPSTAYKSERLVVVIREVGAGKNIRTDSLVGRHPDGKIIFPAAGHSQDGMPYIKFMLPDRNKKKIGTSGGVYFTIDGVTGHRDFANPQFFDVVLFHELVHAYIHVLGVARRLRKDERWGDHDQIEEKLVVGIQEGDCTPLNENAYRRNALYELRTSYLSNDIKKTVVPEETGECTIQEALFRLMHPFIENAIEVTKYIANGDVEVEAKMRKRPLEERAFTYKIKIEGEKEVKDDVLSDTGKFYLSDILRKQQLT